MNEVTPLMRAARAGSVEDMKQLMERGSPLKATDKRGRSALHHAVGANQHGSLRVLLEADPGLATLQDNDGRNVLHLATVAGEVELIKELIKHVDVDSVDNEKHTAIHFATVSGLYNCIELLIENGASPATPDIYGAYPVHYAAQMCGEPNQAATGMKCLQALLAKGGSHINCQDEGGKTPLIWAASAGSSKACKLLAEQGADITLADKDGLTAVHCAASRNKSTCLRTLLDKCNCKVDPVDNNGCTPLFYGIMMDHHRCVKMLLKYGAAASCQDSNGKSPVHCAAFKGSVRYLKLLKKHKGHLELPTTSGDRPIHEAAKMGQNDAVRFLMKRGVGVNVRNNEGLTALHLAATTDNLPLCKDLVKKGADISAVYSSSKSNQLTASALAKEKGCKSCAEYLQYVQEQGIQTDNSANDSGSGSSSDEGLASSSCSEDEEKDDSQQEKIRLAEMKDKEAEIIDTQNVNNNNSPDPKEEEQGEEDGAKTGRNEVINGVLPKEETDCGDKLESKAKPECGMMVEEVKEGEAKKDVEEVKEERKMETKKDVEEVKEERKVEAKKEDKDVEQKEEEKNFKLEEREKNTATPTSDVAPSWNSEELEQKMTAWDGYLQGNVEFLDVVIGSKAPALEDVRNHAKVEMKTLVDKLETLKKEIDDRCQQLVYKMSERESERRKEYEAMINKWETSEARFKKTQNKIDNAVVDYRAKNKDLEDWLEAHEAAWQENKAQRQMSEPTSSNNSDNARAEKHKRWLREKERNYQKKKQSTHVKMVFEHTVESLRAKSAQHSQSTMSRNFYKTSPSSPLTPRLHKSPHSKRTVDQCPILRRSQTSTPDSHATYTITSYDTARLRRNIGDQLNQKLYPKSWEMQGERTATNSDEYLPRWDGGKRQKNRLEFKPRTPKQRQTRQEQR